VDREEEGGRRLRVMTAKKGRPKCEPRQTLKPGEAYDVDVFAVALAIDGGGEGAERHLGGDMRRR
jgi:hypothetical protein